MRKLFRCSLLMLVVVAWTSCGSKGGDLPNDSAVTVTVTPMTATVARGGNVQFKADTSGWTAKPYLTWWMQEQHDHFVDGSFNCDDIQPINQNLIPTCQYGYITVNTMDDLSSWATYYAPQTPGTYHVTFRAVQVSTVVFGGSVERRVTMAITVQ